MESRVVVFGAGALGRETALILREDDRHRSLHLYGFLDDDSSLWGTELGGVPIIGGRDAVAGVRSRGVEFAVVALGSNQARVAVGRALEQQGLNPLTVVHRLAYVAPDVTLGAGCIVAAGSVLNTGALLGEFCLINVNACIGHDCLLGSGVQVSPGANLAGEVQVGHFVTVGIGASVVPRVSLGESSTVGAGAAVCRDLPSFTTAIGVPARPIPTPGVARHG